MSPVRRPPEQGGRPYPTRLAEPSVEDWCDPATFQPSPSTHRSVEGLVTAAQLRAFNVWLEGRREWEEASGYGIEHRPQPERWPTFRDRDAFADAVAARIGADQ